MKKCIECTHPGKDCIPYLMTLNGSDLLSWCKARKKRLALSNLELADITNVPKGTIDRLFASDTIDFRFSTIQPVICALSGCEPEELDCEAQPSAPSPDAELMLQAHDLEKDLQHANRMIDRFETSIRSWKQAVYGLMMLCAVLVVSLMGYLYMDLTNTNVGLVREDYTSPVFLFPMLGIIAAAVSAVLLIRYKLKSKKEKEKKQHDIGG